ncbi:MAG: hypothetical protein JNK90_17625 [Planctomycetaceae bacterium]|nr:hypothetical protein [Planctomycetaceae bacterium]
MSYSTPLDSLPLWLLLVLTTASVLLFIEAGFRLGKLRAKVSEAEVPSPVGTIVGSTLGLLAFMLAFSFSLAASRFDARRQTVVEEANSIGTTYLRAGLLPQPQSSEIRTLLRQYIDSRLEVARTGDVDLALRRADELHLQLWQKGESIGQTKTDSIVVGLFLESLNETIDIHAKRVLVGLRSRLPLALWLALFLLTAFSMMGVGYNESIAKSKRSPAILFFVFGFVTVLALVIELDRPMDGFLAVNQEAMLNLRSLVEQLP